MQRGQAPLHRASLSGRKDVVALLLDRGAAVDAKTGVSGTLRSLGSHGFAWRARGCIELRVKRASHNHYPRFWGWNTHPRLQSGWTPLQNAAFSGKKDVVELLLDRGAAVEAKTGVSGTLRARLR